MLDKNRGRRCCCCRGTWAPGLYYQFLTCGVVLFVSKSSFVVVQKSAERIWHIPLLVEGWSIVITFYGLVGFMAGHGFNVPQNYCRTGRWLKLPWGSDLWAVDGFLLWRSSISSWNPVCLHRVARCNTTLSHLKLNLLCLLATENDNLTLDLSARGNFLLFLRDIWEILAQQIFSHPTRRWQRARKLFV